MKANSGQDRSYSQAAKSAATTSNNANHYQHETMTIPMQIRAHAAHTLSTLPTAELEDAVMKALAEILQMDGDDPTLEPTLQLSELLAAELENRGLFLKLKG